MANRHAICSIIIGSFLVVNILLLAALVPSENCSAWEFGGFKQPKTSIEYPVGQSPQSVVAYDINGDSFPDIVAANSLSSDVSVLLGNGDGQFEEALNSPFPVGNEPKNVVVADVNSDTIPDILTVNIDTTYGGEVTILLGDGNGDFQLYPFGPFAVGDEPSDLAVTDIDGDGFLDIITTNSGSDNVTILQGDGAGNFITRDIVISTGNDPVSLVVIDIDGDEAQDIVTANFGGNETCILYGSGNDTFNKINPVFEKGSRPSGVFVTYVNEDPYLDILTVNQFSNDVSVFLGDETGRTFTEGSNSPFPVGDSPNGFFVADVTGDAIVDIITANTGSDNVSILHGDGTGNFIMRHINSSWVGWGPKSVFLEDLNGDGLLDVVTANVYGNDVSVLLGHGYGLFFNSDTDRFNVHEVINQPFGAGSNHLGVCTSDMDIDGYQYVFAADVYGIVNILSYEENGDFSLLAKDLETGFGLNSIFSGDVNGDGHSDFVAAHNDDNIYVSLGLGGGAFSEKDTYSSGGQSPINLILADLNNDENLDILSPNWRSNDISVLMGQGNGLFQPSKNGPFPVGNDPYSVYSAYLNNDTDPDIVVANRDNMSVSLLFGNGDADFDIISQTTIALPSSPHAVTVADVNGDSNNDILTANWGSNDISVLLGDGNGSFGFGGSYDVGRGPTKIHVIDIRNDGIMDVITLNENSDDLTILIGEGDGTFHSPFFDTISVNTDPRGLFVSDINGNSYPDILSTSGRTLQIHELSLDYDFDGVPDDEDLLPTNPTEYLDFDHDFIGDIADHDDDNDGIPDIAPGLRRDRDSDNDGMYDSGEYDEFPHNRSEWVDSDGDGKGNNKDMDDDNDDVLDFVIGLKRDADNNNDGIYDLGIEYDEFPFDDVEWIDTDRDGTGNKADGDDDGDGYDDASDAFPLDPNEWMDTDEDGMGNNADPDDDNDGYEDDVDAFPLDDTEWLDSDQDGTGDNGDQDDDNDGVPEKAPGLKRDVKNNNDGLYDAGEEYDEFPLDPTEWVDTDNDTIGNGKDEDIDNDTYANDNDRYPLDKDRHKEEEDFFGYTWDINEYKDWLYRFFWSTIILGIYSFLSTGYLYVMKRGIFLTGLFVFQKARKVPYYRKEIRKASSIPTLEHIFDKVEDEKMHNNLNLEQYGMIREEFEKKRIAMTYSVLSSLSPDQQLRIFNDIISRDPGIRQQLAGAGAGAAVGVGAATVQGVGPEDRAGAVSKTADVSDKNVDNVHFTVTAPPRVRPKSTFVVDLWAHLEEHQKKVIEQARLMAEEEKLIIRSVGPKAIGRGTVLTARLEIEDMDIEHNSQTILWEGEIGNANFAVRVPKDVVLGPKPGTANIYIDGLRIAMVNFVIQVVELTKVGVGVGVGLGEGEGEEEVSVSSLPIQEHRIATAFASYARLDRDKVLPRIQGIQKALPSLNIFLDILSLRSGQNWEREIRTIIPSKDIFYLFWSENAQKSHWVEMEWRCALETRGIDFIDPVPLVSPEVVPPPPELGVKHFDDWTLAFTRNTNPNKPDQ